MLDVDYFKVFNDTYGHQAGDDCLIRIASMVQSKLHRVDDFVARYGGEEFILILPNTDCQGALRVGEEIRSAVESLAIEHENSSVSDFVTVSMGSATVVPQQGKNYTTEELVHQADLALYKAKELGRNRIEASTDFPFIALNGEKEISNTSE